MKRLAWSVFCYVSLTTVFNPSLCGQTIYHLHKETTQGFLNLGTAGPDAKSTVAQSANLRNSGLQFTYIFAKFWSAPLTSAGVIPVNSTFTFNLWMDKSANYGQVYPVVVLKLANGDPSTGLIDLCSQ